MNEWKNIIMLFKTPIHVIVCNVGNKTYVLLSRFPLFEYFEANGQNRIHFRLIQALKNSIAWHFLTFTSPSSKLEFVYSPCCGVEEQMLIFSPIPKLTIVLIWKTSACLKFGKTSNRAVENLPQRKLLSLGSERWTLFPVFLFELFVAQCTLVKCSALW